MLKKMENNENSGAEVKRMFYLPNLHLNTPLHIVAESGNIRMFKVSKRFFPKLFR